MTPFVFWDLGLTQWLDPVHDASFEEFHHRQEITDRCQWLGGLRCNWGKRKHGRPSGKHSPGPISDRAALRRRGPRGRTGVDSQVISITPASLSLTCRSLECWEQLVPSDRIISQPWEITYRPRCRDETETKSLECRLLFKEERVSHLLIRENISREHPGAFKEVIASGLSCTCPCHRCCFPPPTPSTDCNALPLHHDGRGIQAGAR